MLIKTWTRYLKAALRVGPGKRQQPQTHTPQFEQLEPRVLLSTTGTAEATEQWFIYLLNRARHDPAEYAAEVGATVNLSQHESRPPLAVNESLLASSQYHSNEMAEHNFFSHYDPVNDEWPNETAKRFGYKLPSWWDDDNNFIESISAGYRDTPASLYGLIHSDGHRRHLLAESDFFEDHKEIGVGFASQPGTQYTRYWSIHTAYEEQSDNFLTGVVFRDLDGDKRYDPGEGLPNVQVSAANQTTQTNDSGGWAIEVVNGTYQVVATGGGFFGTAIASANVADANVAVDFISGNPFGYINFDTTSTPIPKVSLSTRDAQAAEPSNDGSFRIMREHNVASPLTVNFQALSGSATQGVDYDLIDATSGDVITNKITFKAEQRTIDVNVVVRDDANYEPTESVTLTLDTGSGYTLGTQTRGTVTIADNDLPDLPYLIDFAELRPVSGDWAQRGDMYRGRFGHADFISLLPTFALPSKFAVTAELLSDAPSRDFPQSNFALIFDYVSPTNFKFASARIAGDRVVLGTRTPTGWQFDASASMRLDARTGYVFTLEIDGSTASLSVNGQRTVSHNFGESLSNGDLGIGGQNALARAQQISLLNHPDNAPVTLPTNIGFDELENVTGDWAQRGDMYRGRKGHGDLITLLPAQLLPSTFAFNAEALSDSRTQDFPKSNFAFIFDYVSPTDFKFVSARIAGNKVVMGTRTESGWRFDASQALTLQSRTPYAFSVEIDGSVASLLVNGQAVLSHDYGEPIFNGRLGLGAEHALARFNQISLTEVASTSNTNRTIAFSELSSVSGDWAQRGDMYRGRFGNGDLSALLPSMSLTSRFTFSTQLLSDAGTQDFPKSNVAMIFDYVSPTNFKFVSARMGGDRVVMGTRTAAGWRFDASQSLTMRSATLYAFSLEIDGSVARLNVNGTRVMSHDFGEPLFNGRLGVGAEMAVARFKQIQIS